MKTLTFSLFAAPLRENSIQFPLCLWESLSIHHWCWTWEKSRSLMLTCSTSLRVFNEVGVRIFKIFHTSLIKASFYGLMFYSNDSHPGCNNTLVCHERASQEVIQMYFICLEIIIYSLQMLERHDVHLVFWSVSQVRVFLFTKKKRKKDHCRKKWNLKPIANVLSLILCMCQQCTL